MPITLLFLSVACSVGAASKLTARPIANTSSSFGHWGVLDGFTFPLLQGGASSSEVLFQGHFPHASALLVFGGQSGKLLGAINSSTPVSDGRTRLIGFGDFALATQGQERTVAFTATGAFDGGDTFDGVFVQRPGTQDVLPIVSTQQIWEPAGGRFGAFYDVGVAMSHEAHIPFSAEAHIAFSAEAAVGPWKGILLAKLARGRGLSLVQVADTTTPIPGRPALHFKCLMGPAVSSAGEVAFFASHCVTSRLSATIAQQASTRAFLRTQRVGGHCLSRALRYDDVFPGIYRWSQRNGLMAVADASSRLPHAPAETFMAFSAPALGSDGTVAFVALGSSGTYGVYAAAAGGALRVVADTSTAVPGAGGATFADFPYVPSVGATGEVVFYAEAPPPFSGVYAGAASGAAPAPLLTLGDAVEGQPLVFIGFGTTAYDEARRTFAAYLVLGNTTDGVWSFERTGPGNGVSLV